MTSSDFESVEVAARFRDIMRRAAQTQIVGSVPQALVGRVVSVDLARLKAMVWFPGDEVPIDVNIFATAIPGDWQARHQNEESTSTVGRGSLAVVERFKGQMYVTQVLTGGTLSYGATMMNQYLMTQMPQTGDGANTEIVGNSFELFTAAEVFGTINDGDAVMFGPFRANTVPALMVGALDIVVQIGVNQSVKRYRVTTDLFHELTPSWTTSPVSWNTWFRLIPEQEVANTTNLLFADFDLELCMVGETTTFPSGEEYISSKTSLHANLWFRIVKRGTWGDLAAKVAIKTTAFQFSTGTLNNKFGNEKLTGPLYCSGFLGFDGVATHGFENRAESVQLDYFRRPATSGWGNISTAIGPFYKNGSGGMNYTPITGQESAFSVVDGQGGIITMAVANTEYSIRAGMSNGRNTNVVHAVCSVSAIATGAAIVQKVKVKYGADVNEGTITDDWGVHFRLDWGLSGALTPRIEKREAATQTTLASGSNLTYTAGQKFNLLGTISGRTIRMKVWAVGTEEPSGWNVTHEHATDFSVSYGTTAAYAGIRLTGNTNTNPTVNFYQVEHMIPDQWPTPDITGRKWHCGPYRSGLLRMANDLQKTLTHTGTFGFDGTNLTWTGELIVSGIGRNRNGLTSGVARIRQPAKFPGFTDGTNGSGEIVTIYPQGDIRYATSAGIELQPGETLYAAVPPRFPDGNLAGYYLFIVDSRASDYDYELPEWALMIASRPIESTAPIRFGTGHVGHSHMPLVGENGAFLASFTSVASVTFSITFEAKFRTAPFVVGNIDSGAGATARWIPRAINITTTGFTFFLFQAEAIAGTWSDVQCSWSAAEHGF